VSGVAAVWDVCGGARVAASLVHESGVTQISFDRGGRRVVTASWDGTARIWDLAPDTRDDEVLRRNAELLACRRIEETGGIVDLTVTELRERWQAHTR
jgi:WD40 repeat protein